MDMDRSDMEIKKALNDALNSINKKESPEKKRGSLQAALVVLQDYFKNPMTPTDKRLQLKRGEKTEKTTNENNEE